LFCSICVWFAFFIVGRIVLLFNIQLYALLKDTHDLGSRFKKFVSAKSGLDNYAGMSASSAEGTTHTVRKEEQVAFSNWINRLVLMACIYDITICKQNIV
jgi:hypothetical protein